MSKPLATPVLALSLSLLGCTSDGSGGSGGSAEPRVDPALSAEADADAFLDAYAAALQPLYTAASEAEWALNTRIVEGDGTNAERLQVASEAMAAYTGSTQAIQAAQRFLARADSLTALQRKQLEAVLYEAASNPQTVPDVVRDLIAVDAQQSERMFGFTYRVDGEEVTTNDIDEALKTETDLARRRRVWEASKEVGPTLREGLIRQRLLRNASVEALGYDDYFAYKVSDYGMTTREMTALLDRINRELRPLFTELHTWVRYTLAERYGKPVPDLIPAHWLPNRWGQEWSDLVEVEGFDLDAALAEKEPEWIVRQAERFYVSLGFAPLPQTFWDRSSLYPVPVDAPYKKNNHASAWHMDLADDVRSLMSVEPNTQWWETTHHELGHIYYYMSYTNPDVPLVLRKGANRATHEAVGSLMGLAAMQPRFVEAIGLSTGEAQADPMQLLLKEALNYVVFIPWSTGTMTYFEKALYSERLKPEQWNRRWWELAARYQGIEPPERRGEEWCDAATKTHVIDDPAEYYDYALSFVMLFQLHDHIAREILHEDPRDTNYFGSRGVGDFLRTLLTPGGSVDWRELMQEMMGGGLSAQPMVDYFQPLHEWLQEQNRGRQHTLAPI